MLEAQGAETRVVLLDGALETTQNVVKLLNQGGKLHANLICRLLQINSMEVNTNCILFFYVYLTVGNVLHACMCHPLQKQHKMPCDWKHVTGM
jgi:hypothetical protein